MQISYTIPTIVRKHSKSQVSGLHFCQYFWESAFIVWCWAHKGSIFMGHHFCYIWHVIGIDGAARQSSDTRHCWTECCEEEENMIYLFVWGCVLYCHEYIQSVMWWFWQYPVVHGTTASNTQHASGSSYSRGCPSHKALAVALFLRAWNRQQLLPPFRT